eukprot:1747358-Amphidinium_carterae.1
MRLFQALCVVAASDRSATVTASAEESGGSERFHVKLHLQAYKRGERQHEFFFTIHRKDGVWVNWTFLVPMPSQGPQCAPLPEGLQANVGGVP